MAKNQNFRDDDDETVLFETIPARRDYEEPQDETDAERKTRDFFDSLDGKDGQQVGFVDVYKLSSGVGSFGVKDYCERLPSDKYPDPESLMMFLRYKYGAGDYRLLGRIEGKKGIQLNTLLSVAPSKEDSNPRNLPAVIDSKNDGMAAIMAMMQQQNHSTMMMLESLRAEKKPALDLSFLKNPEILALLIPAATTLIGSMVKGRRDPMEQITQLLTITGTIKDMREDDGPRENPDTWPALIGKITDQMGAILPALSAANAGRAPAATPQHAVGQNAGASFAQAFSPYLKQLVAMAKAGAEPEAAATAVLSAVPDNYREALLDFLDRDDCISQLGKANPAVYDMAAWFDDLRNEVLALADGDVDTIDTEKTLDGAVNDITSTTDPTN